MRIDKQYGAIEVTESSAGLIKFRVDVLDADLYSHLIDLDREDVVALRDHLNKVLSDSEEQVWGLAWSQRKRHVVDLNAPVKGNFAKHQKAICDEYTFVYFGEGHHELNSDAVLAVEPCKKCLKKVGT